MIKMLITDVDGTLTDGKIYMGPNGEVMKAFNIKDGYALHELLPELNIIPVIVTGRKSQIVDLRANELKVKEVHQGVKNKREKIEELAQKYSIQLSEIAFIGDDVSDIECIKACGLGACPNDGIEEAKAVAKFIASANGGEGAVRELAEFIAKNLKN